MSSSELRAGTVDAIGEAGAGPAPGLADASRESACRIWPQDPAAFSTYRISSVRHSVHLHPLMQLSQLLGLAKDLQPGGGCRFLAPAATQASAFEHQSSSHQGLAIDEVFRRIEEPGSWIALYNIETVPRYRRFLLDMVESMRPLVEREQPGIFLVTGFIFISAPPSVTPFHIDRENNFWLQIRGRKTLGLWDHEDRETVAADAVEDFIVDRDLGRVRLTDAARARCQEFDSGPGDGMYFPSTTPHMTRTTTDWVVPGDGVSISIGINFYTRTTRCHARVHQFNRVLRRLGIDPTPPGRRPWLDALKAPFGLAVVGLLKLRRRDYVVPPGTV
jgi:hypothetical protein